MQKFVTAPWLIRHLLVLAVLVGLVNLGLWQMRRLEERRTLNRTILAVLDQPAIPLTGQAVDPDELHFRRVSVKGIFDNEAAIALRNQSLNGAPGLHLVTPLRMSGSNQAVLVDRGWIPRGQTDPDPESLAAYDLSGEVSLEGLAYRTQTHSGFLSPVDPPRRVSQERLVTWFRVDIERIQEQTPYPLLPIFIEQLPGPQVDPASLPRQEGSITLTEGPHLGYAIQWFSFAIILIITYTQYFSNKAISSFLRYTF